MAQYSMSTSLIQRSKSSSAVAHAAYVSGTRIVDGRTGQEADYTRRSGVECVAPAIVVPASERETQSAKIERGQLWNMAEAAEKRKDGTPARKIRVALPDELGAKERLDLVQQYAQWIADRHGVAVDYALHFPDKEGDQRNFHAHMILTTRQVKDGQLADKAQIEWNRGKLKEAGLPDAKAMLQELRERWEVEHNRALAEHAPEVKPVSCRSLQAQREALEAQAEAMKQQGREAEATKAQFQVQELDRTPQQHVGWAATAMERRGIATERGDRRREVQQEHRERRGLIGRLREVIATQKWREKVTDWIKHGKDMIAVGLLKQHADLLVAAEYPGDIRKQATAMHRLVSDAHPVAIMDGHAVIDYSVDQNQLFASLERERKPELEKHLTHLMPKQRAPQRESQQERNDRDFEHD